MGRRDLDILLIFGLFPGLGRGHLVSQLHVGGATEIYHEGPVYCWFLGCMLKIIRFILDVAVVDELAHGDVLRPAVGIHQFDESILVVDPDFE